MKPEDVLAYLEQKSGLSGLFDPKNEGRGPVEVARNQRHIVAGLVAMIDRIPPKLLELGGTKQAEFIAALEHARTAFKTWENNERSDYRLANPPDRQDRPHPLKIIQNHLRDAASMPREAGDEIRVFYAWQSDYPTSRNQIGDALERVAARLNERGGAPRIVITTAVDLGDGAVRIDSVLQEKIVDADAFVGDVTPVLRQGGRLYPNPNVLIEVGFALAGKASSRVVLLVYERDPESLPGDAVSADRFPFDIDHVHRIRYKEAATLRKRLQAELETMFARPVP